MNNIIVTIELCAEDRARLDNILAALQKHPIERAGEALHNLAKAAEAAAAQPAAPEEKEAPAQEAPAPEPKKEPKKEEQEPKKPAAPEVTTAELQSKVVQLVGAGKKDATRAIIMEYAKSVGEIPADKRAEVLERLNALEG